MIKKGNSRIMITITDKQKKWLYKFCKNHSLTPSKYITWLLSKKAEEMLLLLNMKKNNIFTEEELMELVNDHSWLDT